MSHIFFIPILAYQLHTKTNTQIQTCQGFQSRERERQRDNRETERQREREKREMDGWLGEASKANVPKRNKNNVKKLKIYLCIEPSRSSKKKKTSRRKKGRT